MQSNPDPQRNDLSFDKVLKLWTVDDSLPPRFRDQVWRRIARAETRPALGFGVWLGDLIAVVLPQPKVACGYLTVLLILGLVVGSWAGQRQTSRLDAVLGVHYVQSVDPFRKPAPVP